MPFWEQGTCICHSPLNSMEFGQKETEISRICTLGNKAVRQSPCLHPPYEEAAARAQTLLDFSGPVLSLLPETWLPQPYHTGSASLSLLTTAHN